MLLGRGFRMHRGHARQLQIGAHLGPQPGQPLDPCGRRAQPIGQGRKFARHQPIERLAGEVRIDQRVPGPFLEGLARPQVEAQRIIENLRVDLFGPRQLGNVHARQVGKDGLRKD